MKGPVTSPEERLAELFGNYRAEWLRDRIFDLFTRPSYFPDLEAKTPCFLIGGRGTGKTTALRSLSYEGQFAIAGKDINSLKSAKYFGFYYRVDTNRVTAFRGEELSDLSWIKLFAHYINLVLCNQILRFLIWHSFLIPEAPVLSENACRRISASLCVQEVLSLPELVEQLDMSRIKFESYLNNLSNDSLPRLSLQGASISELIDQIVVLPQFSSKHFFFLIDEFENFTDEQQIVMNTLIKHSGDKFSFKIGVKELGWRRRSTLNPNEQLNSPADYVRIDINEKLSGARFEALAAEICNRRLAELDPDLQGLLAMNRLLPSLPQENEAEILGLKRSDILQYFSGISRAEEITTLELYFILNWSR